MEHEGLFISNLQDGATLPILPRTALRDAPGVAPAGQCRGLSYLLRFLDAYDFSGDGAEDIQEDNKTLINASVLGLLFEKINGYSEGSYFTPGEVTMHMASQCVERAILRKFNDEHGWACRTLVDLYNSINDKQAANQTINSITICDPAVGSGHFLVSVLNELIRAKSDLKILLDRTGRTLRDYHIEVVSDELVVTDSDGQLFVYQPSNPESQRVQEALFHEKLTLIENCLFGVDINSTSAKICRLRLWIELLKNAYYSEESRGIRTLETLPNIDINIKTGNSLIRRLPLDGSIGPALKKTGRSVAEYRAAVSAYQAARGRDEKRQMESLIEAIKVDFRAGVNESLLGNLKGELKRIETQSVLFEESEEKAADKARRKRTLEAKIAANTKLVAQAELSASSFEWRLEFPQALDKLGAFEGFDVLIGNPPYGVRLSKKEREFIYTYLGKVPDHEIYYLFLNLAHQLLRQGGLLSFIIPNSILFNVFAERYRASLLELWDVEELVDCTDFNVFPDATVKNVILTLRKGNTNAPVGYRPPKAGDSLRKLLSRPIDFKDREVFASNSKNWALVVRVPEGALALAARIRNLCTKLEDLFPEISQGLIAYDKLKGQEEEFIKRKALHSTEKKDSSYRPWLRGEDVRPFAVHWNGEEYIAYGDAGDQVANPREPKYFTRPRVLVREITSPRIYAGYTTDELYNDPAIINVLENTAGDLPILCLLGILNSSLATFYHLHSSPKVTKGTFPKILVADIRQFPIPAQCDALLVTRIVQQVRRLLDDERSRKIGGQTMNELDQLVYELYGLSEAEIQAIQDYFGNSDQ